MTNIKCLEVPLKVTLHLCSIRFYREPISNWVWIWILRGNLMSFKPTSRRLFCCRNFQTLLLYKIFFRSRKKDRAWMVVTYLIKNEIIWAQLQHRYDCEQQNNFFQRYDEFPNCVYLIETVLLCIQLEAKYQTSLVNWASCSWRRNMDIYQSEWQIDEAESIEDGKFTPQRLP